MTNLPTEIKTLLTRLTLEEKVRLLSGEDAWTTYELPTVGLRKMTMSDGPTGVRGPLWDERRPSLTLPSATCVAATWDRNSLYNVGAISAAEARSKGVDVVLGPTINLHRSPLGGRHFECYSEDPYLTGELAVSYIRGAQDNGVGACPKHYVANDSENERFTYDAIIDEPTLRELYLAPFEAAVVDAKAWMIMAAYNGTNGATMTENSLLREPLSTEWGFDGVVVSDWTAVRSVETSANAALDLVMPGPKTTWSHGLVAAVQAGAVAESTINEKVGRILLLAQRVGALGNSSAKQPKTMDSRQEIRRIASQGMVMVENSGVLPLNAAPRTIAVIGSHAKVGRIGGGGSATTIPHDPISPLQGIILGAPAGSSVKYAVGFHAVDELEGLPIEQCMTPLGERGIDVSWIGANGETLLNETRYASFYLAMSEPIPSATRRLVARTTFTAVQDGLHRFGAAGIGGFRFLADGQEILNEAISLETDDLAVALQGAPQRFVEIELRVGKPVEFEFTFIPSPMEGFDGFSCLFGYRAPRLSDDAEWAKAIETARGSDLAVVVVGTTAMVESEGFDRESIALPGRQDELVRAIAAVNKNTVVVVNAGSPVELPWRSEVSAVLLSWFPGEEFGNALADVLFGSSEPGGRLPTTWGATLADTPVTDTDPVGGKLVYREGLNIGYRAWSASSRKPAYHFGHGLGYTTWKLNEISAPGHAKVGASVAVEVSITNTGSRTGSDVVQIYLRRANSDAKRPPLWLAAFDRVEAVAGETKIVKLSIEARRFAHWNRGWETEAGEFEIVATRSAALEHSVVATVALT